jgi:hypothetical protein
MENINDCLEIYKLINKNKEKIINYQESIFPKIFRVIIKCIKHVHASNTDLQYVTDFNTHLTNLQGKEFPFDTISPAEYKTIMSDIVNQISQDLNKPELTVTPESQNPTAPTVDDQQVIDNFVSKDLNKDGEVTPDEVTRFLRSQVLNAETVKSVHKILKKHLNDLISGKDIIELQHNIELAQDLNKFDLDMYPDLKKKLLQLPLVAKRGYGKAIKLVKEMIQELEKNSNKNTIKELLKMVDKEIDRINIEEADEISVSWKKGLSIFYVVYFVIYIAFTGSIIALSYKNNEINREECPTYFSGYSMSRENLIIIALGLIFLFNIILSIGSGGLDYFFGFNLFNNKLSDGSLGFTGAFTILTLGLTIWHGVQTLVVDNKCIRKKNGNFNNFGILNITMFSINSAVALFHLIIWILMMVSRFDVTFNGKMRLPDGKLFR